MKAFNDNTVLVREVFRQPSDSARDEYARRRVDKSFGNNAVFSHPE